MWEHLKINEVTVNYQFHFSPFRPRGFSYGQVSDLRDLSVSHRRVSDAEGRKIGV